MLGRVFAQAGLLLSLALSVAAVPAVVEGSLPRVMLDKRAPTTPSADPFYKPSAAQLASCAPGDVLNSRKVEVAFWSQTNFGQIQDFNQNVQAAYQILACSRDINGQPSSTVTTVMVPYNAKSSPQRLLVFQSAENSASRDCAISYKLLKGSGRGDYDFAIEQILINRELSQGIIVAWTDHEGPDAGFSVGKLAAQAVLDGTRSVLKFGTVIKNPSSVRIAFFGYSGGALATGWAVQEQPVYAPELSSRIVGATYGGPPINPKNTFLLLNKGQAAGVAFAGLAGVGNIYPDTNAYLLEQATDAGKSQLAAFRGPPGYCLVEAVNALQFQDVFSMFKSPQDVVLNAAPIKSVLDAGILGGSNAPSTVPSWPVRIFQANIDEIVVTGDVDNYVNGFCDKGAKVLYVKEYVGEHQSLSITGTPAALAWLDDRFNGVDAGLNGCKRENTASTLISLQAYSVFGQTLLNQLLAIYNAPLGPVLSFGEKRVATQGGSVTSLNRNSILDLINSGRATPSKNPTSSGNSTEPAASSSNNSTSSDGQTQSKASSTTKTTKKPFWQIW